MVKDDFIDEIFVCKKYSPYFKEHSYEFFNYFINEIKILHKIYHKNVVRVFNYYLYPEKVTGYILMEYIKGSYIDDYIHDNTDKINDLFIQTIEGFLYLEDNKVLHRDIRPSNILVNKNGIVKIIDFGFGKNVEFEGHDKSISLNWICDKPDEFVNNIYDFKSEVYFLGKLFQEVLAKQNISDFKYIDIIDKMVLPYNSRLSSFFNVYREIIGNDKEDIAFSDNEKDAYMKFANGLKEIIVRMPYTTIYKKDTEEIVKSLELLYENSLLECYVQNNNKIVSIFLSGSYSYKRHVNFEVTTLKNMIDILKNSTEGKRKVILNNLWERFDSITKYQKNIDQDLPF